MIWNTATASDRKWIRECLGIRDSALSHSALDLAKRIVEVSRNHGLENEYVYFIQNDVFCKVGTSNRPRTRYTSISCCSPHDVFLLGFVPGGTGVERRLHEMLQDQHHKGEWFNLDRRLQLAAAISCFGHEKVVVRGDKYPLKSTKLLFVDEPNWAKTPKILEKTMVGGERVELPTSSV